MENFERSFSGWVLRYRWMVIFVTVALVMLAASGAKNLAFSNDYRVFFSADNPELLAFEALENTYAKNDNVLFVLAPTNGNVFTRKNLSAIQELTEQAWQIPYSNRVDSITNYQHTEALHDDLIVRDLVEQPASLSAEELGRIANIAVTEPLLVNRLVSPSGHVAGVNITVQLPGLNEARETPEVVNFARELAAKLEADYPQIEVYLTGMVVMNSAFSEATMGDMTSLLPLSFALMFLILALLVGGVTGTLATIVIIACSIITAAGVGGFLGFPITPPSATFPTIVLTVAVANCVHILVSMVQGMQAGETKIEAIRESLRLNLQPVFLASVTTALGFLSMNFSDVPPFRHLGNFVAIGVLASLVMSLTFLPAVLSLLPVRVKARIDGDSTMMPRLGDFVVAKRRPLFWGMLAVILMLLAALPRNELNDIYVNYFDETMSFRIAADFSNDNLTGLYPVDYSLDSGEAGGISNPEFLREVEAFAEWYRRQPETLHVNTLTDIMKRLNKNMHGDDPAMYKLPEDRELAAQYLLLYEMSLPYGLDLNNQINVDKSALRFTATNRTLSTKELLALNERAEAWLKANAPHVSAETKGSGTPIMFANIGDRNIKSMLVGTTTALVLISLILVLALRSVKIGLVSLVPNLVPAAMGFGVWGIFVGEIGLSLSIVTSMTLGIVIDDTVHFLSKYLRARREQNLISSQAVVYAFKTVGRALMVTSIILVVGFLVLSTSHFELNAGMGLLTAIVIALALAADFLFLPPLLMKLEEKTDAKLVADVAVADTASG